MLVVIFCMAMQFSVILSTRSRKVRMHRLNEFFPVIAYCDITEVSAAVTSKYRMVGNRNSVEKTFKLKIAAF